VAIPGVLARAALLLSALSGFSACSPASSRATPRPTGCVGHDQAREIWRSLDDRLNAIVLDPAHAGLEDIATGNALVQDRRYIQEMLVAQHVTEREVNRLDSLTVLDGGCNGGTLRIRVALTLTQDDYLAPDGHVDHSDPAVGATFHLLESYLRAGSGWKQSDYADADAPSPTPQLLSG